MHKKPAFEPGIRPCFAGVNTSCGKSGAETELTKALILKAGGRVLLPGRVKHSQ